jgi:hypothetical protein
MFRFSYRTFLLLFAKVDQSIVVVADLKGPPGTAADCCCGPAKGDCCGLKFFDNDPNTCELVIDNNF